MKGKGIPQKCLKAEMYDTYKDNNERVEFSGLKRKHKNLTKNLLYFKLNITFSFFLKNFIN
jgi:hypothetical protein